MLNNGMNISEYSQVSFRYGKTFHNKKFNNNYKVISHFCVFNLRL
jgi:hypothetical protein